MSAPKPTSLYERLSQKCIHFNGLMNKTCDAGINYDDVKIDRPFKLPCLKQGGRCPHTKFPTAEEVKEKIAAIEDDATKVLTAIVMVKAHYEKTKEPNGKITCQCGGELYYVRAAINGHFWAKCKSCGISFNE